MPKTKGSPKTGGRKAGTPNKLKKEMRDFFQEFAKDNFKEFTKAWDGLVDKEKKCKIYIDACKFVIPALTSVDLNSSDGTADRFMDKLSAMRDSETKGTE